MIMYNPFKYTEVVTGKDFINREKELKELTLSLLSGQNIILYSPRRYGKTSLIKETFRRIDKNKAVTVYTDLYGLLSEEDLGQRLANGLLTNSYTTVDKLKQALEKLLTGIVPQIIIERGKTRVRIVWDKKREKESLEEIFDLPQKIAEKNRKHVIIAMDEFQDIRGLNGTKIEKLMRTRIQHHKNVAYLFAGSKVSILLDMFENVENAFYKSGKIFPLHKIPSEEFVSFIMRKFEATGKTIHRAEGEKIVAFTKNHPFFTQMLASEAWDTCEKTKIFLETDLQNSIKRIVQRNTDVYIQLFDNLTRYQKILLVGMCKDPEMSIYSKEFSERYSITPTYVQTALAGLKSRRITENGEISDPFLKEWIKQKF